MASPLRFGPRPYCPPTIPPDLRAVPPTAPRHVEDWPAAEADWSGLCPLRMAPDVWAHWRARPWTVERIRLHLRPLIGRYLEVRRREQPGVPLRAILADVRHSPAQGWRVVLRGIAPLLLEQRWDTHVWQEMPLTALAAVPAVLHPLWFDQRFPEPVSVVACTTPGCGRGVVGRFCTHCGAAVRRRRDGLNGLGPLLPSVYRLWRERGLTSAYECQCGGIVYLGEGGRYCAKCGVPARPDWLDGL